MKTRRKLAWMAVIGFGLLFMRFLWLACKPVSVDVEYTTPTSLANIQRLFEAGVPTNTPIANFRDTHSSPYGGTNMPVSRMEILGIRMRLALWGLDARSILICESKERIEVLLSDGPYVSANKWSSGGWHISPGPTPCYATEEDARKNEGGLCFKLFARCSCGWNCEYCPHSLGEWKRELFKPTSSELQQRLQRAGIDYKSAWVNKNGTYTLYLEGTKTRDLAPIRGMPVCILDITDTQVTDLSPLKGMKLDSFYFSPEHITNGLHVIREMDTNRIFIINGLAAGKFWEKYDSGEIRTSRSGEQSVDPARRAP